MADYIEELREVFKRLYPLKEQLGEEMYEKIREMLYGYFYYKEGVEIMGKRLGIREGASRRYFPEADENL